MIRILKHGDRRKTTCPECHCEFTYEDEDTSYDGQRDELIIVKCPDCGRRITVG